MKKLRIIVMAFIAITVYACSNSGEYNIDVENKRTTLANKSSELYIKEFNELSTSEKYLYFSNKIDQVKNELLNNGVADFNEELESIKITYLATESDMSEFVNLKNKLVNISERLPDEDFIKIFNSLKNYHYSGFAGSISGQIKELLLQEELKPYGRIESKAEKDLPDCNCNWACDWIATNIPGGTSEKDCNPTDTGCGPFGTSGCYRVIKSGGIVVDV